MALYSKDIWPPDALMNLIGGRPTTRKKMKQAMNRQAYYNNLPEYQQVPMDKVKSDSSFVLNWPPDIDYGTKVDTASYKGPVYFNPSVAPASGTLGIPLPAQIAGTPAATTTAPATTTTKVSAKGTKPAVVAAPTPTPASVTPPAVTGFTPPTFKPSKRTQLGGIQRINIPQFDAGNLDVFPEQSKKELYGLADLTDITQLPTDTVAGDMADAGPMVKPGEEDLENNLSRSEEYSAQLDEATKRAKLINIGTILGNSLLLGRELNQDYTARVTPGEFTAPQLVSPAGYYRNLLSKDIDQQSASMRKILGEMGMSDRLVGLQANTLKAKEELAGKTAIMDIETQNKNILAAAEASNKDVEAEMRATFFNTEMASRDKAVQSQNITNIINSIADSVRETANVQTQSEYNKWLAGVIEDKDLMQFFSSMFDIYNP